MLHCLVIVGNIALAKELKLTKLSMAALDAAIQWITGSSPVMESEYYPSP